MMQNGGHHGNEPIAAARASAGLCIRTASKLGDAGRRGGVRGRGGWTSFRLVAQRLPHLRTHCGAGDPAEPHPDLSAGLRAGGVEFDRPAGSLGARGVESCSKGAATMETSYTQGVPSILSAARLAQTGKDTYEV